MPLLDRMPTTDDPDAAYAAFADWAAEQGLQLYPAQDEALLEIVTGSHVILATPTGSGKSLVAVAAHATAVAQGKRSYYTAPIKALVSEKFFALVDIFGAANVGMVTGDSSVNPDAPILCCTAEILANLALRRGADAPVDQVVMDEFHFYSDPDRGWAWQVPLLTLPRVQFVLMSATLGDVSAIAEDLSRRTGRPTARVTSVERPVPLHFYYAGTQVQETVEELLHSGQAPVYIVHFSQAAAMERAQALSSIRVIDRDARDRIADEIGGFRFTTGFGRTLSRLVRSGIGVHHAGMLPKYRRLVEQLAQRGLLKIICGTDTLGVGINVPIRTVLLTALTKYDGTRTRQLTAREFHQIAGRAGRAGYDTAGTVIVEAPEHEIENAKSIAKAGDDVKKRRKIIRKKAPEGFVSWGEPSFRKLVDAEPEPLASSMQLTAAMLINVIARGGDVLHNVRSLVFDNHEPRARQFELARRAIGIYRTLVAAEVVEVVGGQIRLMVDLPPNFALNQPLSPFALAAFELLDPDSPTHALDVISVIESTLDNPRPVLSQQEFKARGEAVAAMKAEGIEYDQRMELLEGISYPRPLADLLEQSFETFASSQPWVRDFELRPKSVVRDMFERAMTFGEYVSFYALGRSEGLVLRYLSDAYRAIRQTVPEESKGEELLDLIEWLGELVRQVDSSLVDEWEQLVNPALDPEAPVVPPAPPSVLTNRRAFLVLVRNELFRRVQLAALDRPDDLGALDAESGMDGDAWAAALDAYYGEHDTIGTGPAARSSTMLLVTEEPGVWKVRQILDDPSGDHDWGLRAEVDLVASEEEGIAVVRILGLDRL
ncbi:MAG: superfamily helicase [Naasia sp.]|jgi:superfamily II RNA helicase|uniref:DEAD/DEAH box helicase n=1 Tax=Naasia sp. TaxID=2546198 RepID=UPI002636AD9C|nr:DEAD/DEAH box helicase [Naasia sp.]MCU1569732.1 superfamily helicase [Naasia sp.]